jgi:ABC-type glycerol-3-phosphate transport system substrate-binding protein
VASSASKDAAAAFIAALTQPETAATWRKAGFEPPRS